MAFGGLRQITVGSFKRFDRFTLTCGNANVLVGPNNAGKSTLLDALRILYGALRYAVHYRPKLISTDEGTIWGYEIPDGSIPLDIANVISNYADDDAEVAFTHANGTKLHILLNPRHLTRLHIPTASRVASTAHSYFRDFSVDVVVVPTLSPFEQAEAWVQDETIERNRYTRLGSRYFRNIWYRSSNADFAELAALVENTWDNVRIKKPTRPHYPNAPLEMFFEEKGADRIRRDREVSCSGFGFQVWLQILTHVLRARPNSIFVLDEPDIYLHPDLQRSLLRLLRGRFSQYFLATYSTEIINESDAGDVVLIKSEDRAARRVRTDEDYNNVFAYIGSLENVELARLSRAKKVIFFEGNDRKLLTKFTEKASVRNTLSDSDTLVIAAGGFSQWKRVVDAAWTFKEVLQVDVSMFALFDRDYRDQREVYDTIKDVEQRGIGCAIWHRKEIENYALTVPSITRTIIKRAAARGHTVSEQTAREIVDEVTETYKHEVHGNMLKHRLQYERQLKSGLDETTIYEACNKEFEELWKRTVDRLKLLPGKKFIGELSARLQSLYGCSVSVNMLIEELRANEIDPEMIEILHLISAFCEAPRT